VNLIMMPLEKKVFRIFLFFNIDDDKISIENETYNKHQLNLIAAKILNVCNVNSTKNKNNNTQLRIGDGKLMMTNGMSVSDFQRKYKL
jgi:hypothetical protein